MIGRVLLAALLAGIAAGLIMGIIQHVRLTPLIIEAETYETAGQAHDAAAAEDEGWKPAGGWQRTLATTATAAMTGAAFALLLAGISLVAGLPITRRNGVVWGLCGFLAVTLAPAMGLPPELPGMPAGDLVTRQIWWLGTIAATGIGLFLIATRRETWALAAAIVIIALPHLVGAPQPVSHESAVPAQLAATFVANSIAAAAIFWSLIGTFLGLAINRFAPDAQNS